MDRTDREHRHQPHLQSSLPSSLIPHLYSGPQQPRYSQTRTTLQKDDCLPHDRLRSCRLSPLHPVSPSAPPSFDQHRRQLPPLYLTTSDARDRHLDKSLPDPASTPMHRALDTTPPSSFPQRYSPIYSDPRTARPSMASNRGYSSNLPLFTGHRAGSKPQTNWRQGEAGPSSHLLPASHDESLSNHRLGSRQLLRVDLRSSESYRRTSPGTEQVPPFQDQSRHMRERDSYHPSSNRSWPGDHATQCHERLPGPSRLLDLSLHEQSSSREKSYESSCSYSTVGSLSISAVSLSYARERSPDTGSLHRTVSCSFDVTSNDGDEGTLNGKRGREESVERGANAKKTKPQRGVPKKTPVACNFCRGRKLRCNGDRPKCYNCGVRNFECEYVPVQRRRGPGKAPKGSRSKKVTGGHARSSSKAATDRPPSMIAEHELESLAPEVRPYMSVLSLNSFGSHALPPRGESPRHHPRRRRTSQSPETSSWEAGSDAEESVE